MIIIIIINIILRLIQNRCCHISVFKFLPY